MKSYGRRVSSLDAVGLATGMLAGFQPGSAWIQEVDLALNDGRQQYSNIEETSAMDRTP